MIYIIHKVSASFKNRLITLFRMGFFGAAHRWGAFLPPPPLPKICHTYPTMSYTLPKEDRKNI